MYVYFRKKNIPDELKNTRDKGEGGKQSGFTGVGPNVVNVYVESKEEKKSNRQMIGIPLAGYNKHEAEKEVTEALKVKENIPKELIKGISKEEYQKQLQEFINFPNKIDEEILALAKLEKQIFQKEMDTDRKKFDSRLKMIDREVDENTLKTKEKIDPLLDGLFRFITRVKMLVTYLPHLKNLLNYGKLQMEIETLKNQAHSLVVRMKNKEVEKYWYERDNFAPDFIQSEESRKN
jgi:hypothetical protein